MVSSGRDRTALRAAARPITGAPADYDALLAAIGDAHFGLDLYSLHESIEAVLRYLDTVDPKAARRARARYACFDHFGEDPQVYGRAVEFGLACPYVSAYVMAKFAVGAGPRELATRQEKGDETMTRKKDAQHGVPGEGKGRRDEVGHSGIWPASGPLPPGSDVPIVGQDELAHGPHAPVPGEMPAGASAFETDPVCGTRINTAGAERRDYNGHAYYFDSLDCRRRFEEAPERFTTMPDRRRT